MIRQLKNIITFIKKKMPSNPSVPSIKSVKKPPSPPAKIADAQTSQAVQDAKSKREELRNAEIQQDLAERKKYAGKVFNLIKYWLWGILIIVLLQGFPIWFFNLPEKVMMTLLGGTTVNILESSLLS